MGKFIDWLQLREGFDDKSRWSSQNFDNYYDIGHSGVVGDALWWMTDAGNVEVISLRQGEGQEVRHFNRMKRGWYGRYDKKLNKVSVAGGDSDFNKEYVQRVLSIEFPSASITFI